MLSIDDIELNEWAVNNKFARFWYCRDLRNCSILKIAIKKAIHKSPHDVQQRHLFPDIDEGQEIQFFGFCVLTQDLQCVEFLPHSQFCCLLYR
jgi:hypothetical protein